MNKYDLHIQGGTIVDGTRVPRYTGDVWVKDGRIAKVGGKTDGVSERVIEAKGLMLASDERLSKYLGVSPGSVSILALINDVGRAVELVVDRDVWSADAVLAHPLVNTATLVIEHSALERFLRESGHEPRVLDVPEAAA